MTNLQIAKLYLAANAGTTATALDAAITDGSALTAVNALTQTALLNAAYQAAFGRDADAEGLAYWGDRLDNGLTTTGLVDQLVAGAAAYVAPTADAPRTINGVEFTAAPAERANDVTISTAKTTAEAAASSASVGSVAAAVVTVVDAATQATAIATIDAADAVADAAALAGTTLTTTNGDALTGTTGDDAFTGNATTIAASDTLHVNDKIDGAAGTDTLTIGMNKAFAGFSSTGGITNVENIALTNTAAVATTFDASGVVAASMYSIDATNAGITLNDMDQATTIELKGQTSGTFANSFATGASEIAGLTDSMTFKVDTLGTVEDINTTAVELKSVVSTLTDIETVNLESTGVNTIGFAGADLKTLNMTGAGSVNVTTVSTSLTGVDGSTATGAITIDTTATTSAALATIKTGTADDKITANTADLTTNAIINAGAGTDVLTLDSGATTVQFVTTGLETVALNTISGALIYSGGATGSEAVANVSSVAATANTVSFVNMGATAMTFDSKGATVNAGAISSSHTGATVLNYSALAATVTAATGNDDPLADYTFSNTADLTINVGEFTNTAGSDVTAASATKITLNSTASKDKLTGLTELTDIAGTITAAKATDITVNADGKLAGLIIDSSAKTDAGGTITVNSTSIAAGQTLYVNAVKADTFNLTANAALDMNTATTTVLTGVQTSNITMTKGALDLSTESLTSISSLTVSGGDVTSAVTLDNLGGAIDYGMTVTASGLKAGFTTGTIDVNTGQNIVLDVSGITGTATIDAINGTTVGKDVTIKAGGVIGGADFGNVTGTGTVNIDFEGTLGQVTIDDVSGSSVTITAGNTITGLQHNATAGKMVVTAKTDATLVLSNQQANGTVGITAAAGSTALVNTITGGDLGDDVTVTGVATNSSMTVSGDFGGGTDTITLDGSNSTVAAGQTLNISGATNYETSTITGSAMKDTITGGTKADTIVVSLTTEGDSDVINGGDGTDILSLTGASHTFAVDASLINVEEILLGNTDGITVDLTGQTEAFSITTTTTTAATIIGGDGVETIVINAGSTGKVADITAGLGADIITLAATTTADTITMTTGGAIAVDEVTNFVGGEDVVEIDLSDLNALVGTLTKSDGLAAVATVAAAGGTVTAAASVTHDFGATIAELTTIAGATAYTTATLETALEAGGSASGGTTAGDAFLIAYDDTSSTYLAYVTDNVGTTNGAFFTDVTVTNLIEFVGINAEDLVTADIAVIA